MPNEQIWTAWKELFEPSDKYEAIARKRRWERAALAFEATYQPSPVKKKAKGITPTPIQPTNITLERAYRPSVTTPSATVTVDTPRERNIREYLDRVHSVKNLQKEVQYWWDKEGIDISTPAGREYMLARPGFFKRTALKLMPEGFWSNLIESPGGQAISLAGLSAWRALGRMSKFAWYANAERHGNIPFGTTARMLLAGTEDEYPEGEAPKGIGWLRPVERKYSNNVIYGTEALKLLGITEILYDMGLPTLAEHGGAVWDFFASADWPMFFPAQTTKVVTTAIKAGKKLPKPIIQEVIKVAQGVQKRSPDIMLRGQHFLKRMGSTLDDLSAPALLKEIQAVEKAKNIKLTQQQVRDWVVKRYHGKLIPDMQKMGMDIKELMIPQRDTALKVADEMYRLMRERPIGKAKIIPKPVVEPPKIAPERPVTPTEVPPKVKLPRKGQKLTAEQTADYLIARKEKYKGGLKLSPKELEKIERQVRGGYRVIANQEVVNTLKAARPEWIKRIAPAIREPVLRPRPAERIRIIGKKPKPKPKPIYRPGAEIPTIRVPTELATERKIYIPGQPLEPKNYLILPPTAQRPWTKILKIKPKAHLERARAIIKQAKIGPAKTSREVINQVALELRSNTIKTEYVPDILKAYGIEQTEFAKAFVKDWPNFATTITGHNRILRQLKQILSPKAVQILEDMKGTAVMRGVYQILNIPRALMTSFDLSFPFRQGIFFAPSHPKEWASAFYHQIRYFGSEKAYNHMQKLIRSHPNYQLAKQARLPLTDMGTIAAFREEPFQAYWAEQMPAVGRVVKASNRAYTGFANKFRFDLFNSMIAEAEKLGLFPRQNPEMLNQIAQLIGAGTGRGRLGAFEGAAVPLNAIFFSPRLMSARLTLLNPAYYIKGDPFVRKQALKSLFAFTSMNLAVLGLAKLAGAKVGLDPRSADFGKIRIGNTRLDTTGGFGQYIRLAAQLMLGEQVSSVTGRLITLGEGYKATTRLGLLARSLEYKEAPVTSFAMDMLRGKTLFGREKFTWTVAMKEAGKRFVPMIIQDAVEIVRDDPNMLPLTALGIFGVGIQTYETEHEDVQKIHYEFGKVEPIYNKFRELERTGQLKKSIQYEKAHRKEIDKYLDLSPIISSFAEVKNEETMIKADQTLTAEQKNQQINQLNQTKLDLARSYAPGDPRIKRIQEFLRKARRAQ